MNGLYLPALISVLYEADQNTEIYENLRWFKNLSQLLRRY